MTTPPSSSSSSTPTRLLFLCRANSCRSQMAEAWCHHLHSSTLLLPYSAGLMSTKPIDQRAVLVMKEAGVDMSSARSKSIDDFNDKPLDVVISVCDADCPTFRGKAKVIHHSFDDPPSLVEGMGDEEERLKVYRKVRDEIRVYVQSLPTEMSRNR